MSKWQLIDTAPKDGTSIMTCVAGWRPCVSQWVEFEGHARWSLDPEIFMEEDHFARYFHECSYEPTHWRPLPKSPKVYS